MKGKLGSSHGRMSEALQQIIVGGKRMSKPCVSYGMERCRIGQLPIMESVNTIQLRCLQSEVHNLHFTLTRVIFRLSSQMEAIVLIILQIFFATHAILKKLGYPPLLAREYLAM